MNRSKWWKKAIVYQIYPRSFQDSNGDGTGDLTGIINRLPYLKELGIDVIWISPMYLSPMDDNGYDISDYYRVDPLFGTNADMEQLIAEAKQLNIKIILDLVLNHCSDEHVWFKKAVVNKNGREAGYFYFKHGEEEPNNWRSNFGGSVWSRLPDGRWYYHTFSPRQPDLNWENEELREELYNMVSWWMEKGIAGFRVDAITFIKKDLSFASRENGRDSRYPVENLQNYFGIDKFLSELKTRVFDKYECMTVAEAPGVNREDFSKYAGENGYFSMIFDFSWESMEDEPDKAAEAAVERLKKRMFDSQRFIKNNGWCGNFLENHDQSRCMHKYLEEKDRNYQSITALGVLYFFLYGTPYIYQGQEIGMTNAKWNSIEEMDDVRAKRTWKEKAEQGEDAAVLLKYYNDWGRDNARTPMQWDTSRNAGFTEGEPWLKVQENYKEINVEKQTQSDESILSFYKKLIMLHKSPEWEEVLAEGEFLPVLEDKKGIFAYKRKLRNNEMTVLVNFVNTENELGIKEYGDLFTNKQASYILINNCSGLCETENRLIIQPYQAIVWGETIEEF